MTGGHSDQLSIDMNDNAVILAGKKRFQLIVRFFGDFVNHCFY